MAATGPRHLLVDALNTSRDLRELDDEFGSPDEEDDVLDPLTLALLAGLCSGICGADVGLDS